MAGLLIVGARAWGVDFVFLRSAENDTLEASKQDLKEIFTGKKRNWKNGQAIDIGLPANGSTELKWIALELFGASDTVLLLKIKHETFKGNMRRPASVASVPDCITLVKKSAGGICVVDSDSVRTLPRGVAILKYTK